MSWIRGIASWFGPGGDGDARVTSVTEGRSGRVVYTRGPRRFELYFELGGGEALAVIHIPSEADWESRTGLPVAERGAVLGFIGRAVVKDQTAGRGRYEVRGAWMTVFA